MTLPNLNNLSISGSRVILRADLDVKIKEGKVADDARLSEMVPTLNALLEKGATKITIIGHMGRPEGKPNPELSLAPLLQYFKERYNLDVSFLAHKPRVEFFETYDEYSRIEGKIVLLENLRFYEDEEKNDSAFAEELVHFGEVFVNEAFASSHRTHASVDALPRLVKAKGENLVAVGLHFEKEIENLSRLLENPEHPVVFVISGLKDDKLTFLTQLKERADAVLIGGRLPEFVPEDFSDPKVLVSRLNPDKEDITLHSVEKFEQTIAGAKTVFVSGPVGKYEEEGHLLGTRRVFDAISKASALKIAGGGDTTAAIHALKLEQSFDWISSGGGASLEFVAKGTLPGLEALC